MEAATPSRKQLTHDRILDTAARVLRDTGFAGVGVADIMKRAGLTHGGFYAHFPSRDALLAEALQRAGQDSRERLQRSVAAGEGKTGSRFRALVEGYLSEKHLKSPESGCPAAGAARVESLLAVVGESLPPGHPSEAAGLVAAQLIGALQLARTLGDNAKGRRHLAAARRFLLEQYEPAQSGSG
jgi:TetR/AcrR family transcriptional repressor of nem operon